MMWVLHSLEMYLADSACCLERRSSRHIFDFVLNYPSILHCQVAIHSRFLSPSLLFSVLFWFVLRPGVRAWAFNMTERLPVCLWVSSHKFFLSTQLYSSSPVQDYWSLPLLSSSPSCTHRSESYSSNPSIIFNDLHTSDLHMLGRPEGSLRLSNSFLRGHHILITTSTGNHSTNSNRCMDSHRHRVDTQQAIRATRVMQVMLNLHHTLALHHLCIRMLRV